MAAARCDREGVVAGRAAAVDAGISLELRDGVWSAHGPRGSPTVPNCLPMSAIVHACRDSRGHARIGAKCTVMYTEWPGDGHRRGGGKQETRVPQPKAAAGAPGPGPGATRGAGPPGE